MFFGTFCIFNPWRQLSNISKVLDFIRSVFFIRQYFNMLQIYNKNV